MVRKKVGRCKKVAQQEQEQGNFVERIRDLTDAQKFSARYADRFINEARELSKDVAVPPKAQEILRRASQVMQDQHSGRKQQDTMTLPDGTTKRRQLVIDMREELTIGDFFPEEVDNGEWVWLQHPRDVKRKEDDKFFALFAEYKQPGEPTLYAAVATTLMRRKSLSWLKQQPFSYLTPNSTRCSYDEFSDDEFEEVACPLGGQPYSKRQEPEPAATSSFETQLTRFTELNRWFLDTGETGRIGRSNLKHYLEELHSASKATRQAEERHARSLFDSLHSERQQMLQETTAGDEQKRQECERKEQVTKEELGDLPVSCTTDLLKVGYRSSRIKLLLVLTSALGTKPPGTQEGTGNAEKSPWNGIGIA
jgi:hypothetical protein